MENNTLGAGFMAVFAVSGSVVFLAMQAHKRLLSDFMKKMDFEFKHSPGGVREVAKKSVRFSDDVLVMPAEKVGDNHHKYSLPPRPAFVPDDGENLEAMPLNRQVMYRGILQYRNLIRGCN